MENKGIKIDLTIKEIVEVCCNDCKLKIRELVKNKIANDLIDGLVGQ